MNSWMSDRVKEICGAADDIYGIPRRGRMPNKRNNKKEHVKRGVNETASTNHRTNGKMQYQSYNLEGLTVPKQREFIRIRQLINNLPELRVDRISRLTKAIDEGTYHVSSKKIAEAIFQKHFYDRPH